MDILLSIVLNPRNIIRYSDIVSREIRVGAVLSKRCYTDDNIVMEERSSGISLTCIATADIEVAGAQHIFSDHIINFFVTVSAGCLVYRPFLNMAKSINGWTIILKLTVIILFLICQYSLTKKYMLNLETK